MAQGLEGGEIENSPARAISSAMAGLFRARRWDSRSGLEWPQ